MYIASKVNAKKIFHAETCVYGQRIKSENSVYFYCENDANEKGYRRCKCCSHLQMKYQKEKLKILQFIKEYSLKGWLNEDALHVETDVASWKIVFSNKDKRFFLFHENREIYRTLSVKNGKLQHNYHLQYTPNYKSIIEYLDFIVKHDIWKASIGRTYLSLPRSTKKQRSAIRREKKQFHKYATHRVYNLIEKLNKESDIAYL